MQRSDWQASRTLSRTRARERTTLSQHPRMTGEDGQQAPSPNKLTLQTSEVHFCLSRQPPSVTSKNLLRGHLLHLWAYNSKSFIGNTIFVLSIPSIYACKFLCGINWVFAHHIICHILLSVRHINVIKCVFLNYKNVWFLFFLVKINTAQQRKYWGWLDILKVD